MNMSSTAGTASGRCGLNFAADHNRGPAAQGQVCLDRAMDEDLHRTPVLVGLSPG
jgi:hypothetical protein